jgi:dTDP-4-amino-4,6-dideoxy-D-galactose acyltransferase
MPGESLCRLLEWDSEFFGRRIASASVSRLRADTVEEILAWCQTSRIECLYFLADPDDVETVRLAEDHGFRLVDIRMTLECDVPRAPTEEDCAPIRPAREEDIPALQAIARVSYDQTRFHYDGGFPVERCQKLYETWIEKSCRGWAQAVLVGEWEGGPAGVISCVVPKPGHGQIGLLGVEPRARGAGLAAQLVRAAQRWFAGHEAAKVSVVTQGRNLAAQRLYQRCGFRTRAVQLWYHRWFIPAGGT